MATKTATIIIDVDDKSLVELNSEIKTLETSMSKLKVGTAEWQKQNKQLGTLKTQYQNVTREATALQNVTQKISGQEALRGIAKLGAGMVGAFASASGAAKLLGGNAEQWDEMTAKAATLMSMMGGLNQVSELFGKDTTTMLKGLGGSFKGLVTSVKAASTGMKAALISTGIGALVVGVGLLIANWDKLAKLISRTEAKQQKAAEDAYKSAQLATKASEQRYQTAIKTLELQKEFNFSIESASIIADRQVLLEEAKLKLIKAQNEENNEYINTLNTGTEKSLKMTKEEIANAKEIANEKTKTIEQEIYLQSLLFDKATINSKVSKEIQKQNDIIEESKNKLIILNVTADKQTAIYDEQRKILIAEMDSIIAIGKATGGLTLEQGKQLLTLNNQVIALKNQNTERKRILKIEIDALATERSKALELKEINDKYRERLDSLQEEYNLINNNTKSLEDQLNIYKNQKADYDELLKKKAALINFDERGEGLLYQQNKDLEDQLLNMNDLFAQSAAMINMQLEGKKYDEDKIDAAAKELTFFKQIADAQVAKLNNDKLGYENRKKDLLNQKEQLGILTGIAEIQKTILESDIQVLLADFKKAKTDEERKTILEKIVALESNLAEETQKINDGKIETINLNNEIVKTDNDILTANQEINNETQSIIDKNKELADIIEQQSRGYKDLQDGLKKYQEEITVGTDIIRQSLELVATAFDNRAKKMQKAIDAAQKEMDGLMSQEEERKDRLLSYEAQLEDANGSRYDELMKKIADEKKANGEAQIQYANADKARLDAIDKQNKAEKRAAQFRKAQAVIDAIIAGALSVVKALPNVVLAVATGVLAAASIATIVATKIPEPPQTEAAAALPKMAKGGTMEKTGMALVGEQGPELVALPQGARVYSNPDSMRMLASGYVGAYAQGGTVPAISSGGQEFINYDRLINGIANAIMLMPNPVVSVVKISNAQNEVKLTKTNAGLTR